MKTFQYTILASGLLIMMLLNACSKSNNASPAITYGGPPPSTWQEHWFEHNSLLKRVFYDNNQALYYDDAMDRKVTWPDTVFAKVWAYAKKTYGNFGDSSRLYVVMHQGIYTGEGHPGSYFDAAHDYRNMIDVGSQDWTVASDNNLNIPIHETGHIICGANNGVKGSPSDVIWGDSKFMEIYIYDVLINIGRPEEAAKVFNQMQTQYDNFPSSRSQWFKNWFYPIYNQYGKAAVLSKYFVLLSQNFPKKTNAHGFEYTRDLKFGEFIHFWSGAAGVNLKAQATIAFGWNMAWEQELKNAQEDFPNVKYPY
ncbi:hypothetical protein [Mucilaginibacter paludis]|uniref:Uncharacterized protein n=1 Tax=Mucilaginibacter paludis DSM 18603 TaxID=714943 RepID=H1Y2L7_9SPHI|nr:hypothetical protein [Mucilaginibacter paludis]EHQ28065.1 hypothetical protein Mucpa_3974 [Mucilaginibacter paludis DSM 18603]